MSSPEEQWCRGLQARGGAQRPRGLQLSGKGRVCCGWRGSTAEKGQVDLDCVYGSSRKRVFVLERWGVSQVFSLRRNVVQFTEEQSPAHDIHPSHHSCLWHPALTHPYTLALHASARSCLKSSLSRLSHRELCPADWPQCSCDHHQTRGGMSVSVCMPGLCQVAGSWWRKGCSFPSPPELSPRLLMGLACSYHPRLCPHPIPLSSSSTGPSSCE